MACPPMPPQCSWRAQTGPPIPPAALVDVMHPARRLVPGQGCLLFGVSYRADAKGTEMTADEMNTDLAVA